MTEQRTITIAAYRTPDGVPTCCLSPEQSCQFLGSTRMGMQDHCLAHLRDIYRDRDANGWPVGFTRIPADGCIVWPEGSKT